MNSQWCGDVTFTTTQLSGVVGRQTLWNISLGVPADLTACLDDCQITVGGVCRPTPREFQTLLITKVITSINIHFSLDMVVNTVKKSR